MVVATAISCVPLALSAAAVAALDAPTFYGDVLPILQSSCQDCHRPAGSNYGGMVAPMSLVTYEETRPWARAILRQITAREMPPWDASPRFHGVFANERTLSDVEIETIRQWVESNAPAGDPASAPPVRQFASSDGWIRGEPDLVLTIPVAYEVGDEVSDVYTAFVVDLTEEMLPEDAFIRGFQCKPGTPIIHHFNANLLPPDEHGELPPPPDRFESETIAPVNSGSYLGGVASGAGANWYPDGYAVRLPKGSRITFDIHYTKEAGPGTRVVDSTSQIGFYFATEPPAKEVSILNAAIFDIDLPPGRAEYRLGPASVQVEEASEILALTPHMHLRGRGAKFVAFYPDGGSEVLLEVPRYDFAWQTAYYYDELKRVPAGTRIEFTAWYDNSPEYAAERGFDPEQHVRFGRWSSDEMMMGFVLLAPGGE
ncbi:MAG: hypothetical protein R3190_07265 [Thermoanaerobaculia bacterium]|nr:hypothetical protein [Thermoanaerobaculia bacterium]